MNCPKCSSHNIAEIDNLHSVWQCLDCGFQGDGAEFDTRFRDDTEHVVEFEGFDSRDGQEAMENKRF